MITLHAARLTFVVLSSKGKIHAHDAQGYVPSHSTMCGIDIPEGTPTMPERNAHESFVCGRCLMSLRTYSGGQVVFEKE